MNISLDFGYHSINHYGEEVCGDRVNIRRDQDGFIGVLADGMGSGVKANILSTMGSTILSTMLSGGESVESAVDVVIRSLPVCSERGMNYCTFSVVHVDKMGIAKLVEFDNPQAWIIRNRQLVQPERSVRLVEGKKIYESSLPLIEGDIIVVTSDGAVNAGMDNQFSFRWNWDSVASWLCQRAHRFSSSRRLATELVEAVNNLYGGKPTDDVTAMVLRFPETKIVNIMYGPPEYPEDDAFMVHEFLDSEGIKIICGGTTSNIVSRVMDSPVVTMPETAADGVPPISFMADIDLVTEGVLTVTRAGDLMEQYYGDENSDFRILDQNNGAAILARQLIEDCTELRVFIGRARNPGYEDKKVPLDLDMKMKAIDRICTLMDGQGIPVSKYYY